MRAILLARLLFKNQKPVDLRRGVLKPGTFFAFYVQGISGVWGFLIFSND